MGGESFDGQYLRQTKEARSEQSWVWLQNVDLKREAESLIKQKTAAQNQSIRTNFDKRLTIVRKTRYVNCVRKLMKV